MILITSDITLGTKAFMHSLADAIRPALVEAWDEAVLEDFDLDLLQEMIHFGHLPADDFNIALDAIKQAQGIDKNWQDKLITAMQADPRYKETSPA